MIDQVPEHQTTPPNSNRKTSFLSSSLFSPTPIRVRKPSANIGVACVCVKATAVAPSVAHEVPDARLFSSSDGAFESVPAKELCPQPRLSHGSTRDNSLNSSISSGSTFSAGACKHKKSMSSMDLIHREFDDSTRKISKSAICVRQFKIEEDDDIYLWRPQNPQVLDEVFRKMDILEEPCENLEREYCLIAEALNTPERERSESAQLLNGSSPTPQSVAEWRVEELREPTPQGQECADADIVNK